MFEWLANMDTIISPFSFVFSKNSFNHFKTLLLGVILTRGPKRITTLLRTVGLTKHANFSRYHRFVSRAKYDSTVLSQILLGLLLALLPHSAPILILLDDTLERRQGKRIHAKGYYRDPIRSTEKKVVKCYGLKWLCATILVPLPWCARPWALPVLCILMPSKHYNNARGRKHRSSIDWSLTVVRLLSRWLKRPWVLIADGAFASGKLAHCTIKNQATLISRLRCDAALFTVPAAPACRSQAARSTLGPRLPSLLKRKPLKIPSAAR